MLVLYRLMLYDINPCANGDMNLWMFTAADGNAKKDI